MRQRGFRAFSEYDGYSMIENQKKQIISSIESQTDDYILNVNKQEFIDHIISKFKINPVQIHKDELTVSTYEAQIPAEEHPVSYYVHSGKSYPKDVIKYHLPFTGDSDLLKVQASTYSLSSPLITIEEECICFEIINFNLSAEKIQQSANSTISSIEKQIQYLTKDLNAFNDQIENLASQTFESRREQILKKNDLVSKLGVPIRKSNSTSGTFSVPAKRTKTISSKPKPRVSEKGYKPEPTLDETIYQQILSIIHDVGKQFERLPSTYSEKEEEHLRDHILLILEPNFEGSATGETFNKTGKTDILLRHEGKNVFIAELKYWKGQKSYLETIDQLLGYLTWRDSKAAIVMFVQNKEFSKVLETVKEVTPNHSNYLGEISEKEDGWYFYRFHLKGDENREVKLSVMLFHLPK